MSEQGVMVVISGFSGSGKGTLMKALLERYPNYALSVSCTTRAPRPGEVNGRDYYFVSEEEFCRMIRDGELVEYACYCGRYYGTPRAYVEQRMAEGKDVLLEIEIQGALQIKEKFPETVLIFVLPPSAAELKNRLCGRGTETEDVINARLHRAVEEAQDMDRYDYLLVNDDLESCVSLLHQVIQSQHFKAASQKERIDTIRQELKSFT